MENSSSNSGCGCLTLIIAILVFFALIGKLPVNDKTLNIDIFPPGITLK